MKESILKSKQLSKTTQKSGCNQNLGFVDNRVHPINHIYNFLQRKENSIKGANRAQNICFMHPVFQFCGWKTGSIDKKIKSEQSSKTDKRIVDTAHHILPKGKLEKAYKALSEPERKAIGNELTGVNVELTSKQIKSLEFNLTLGPRPELRTDDPGDSFDPNYSDGALTPRSSALKEVLDPITGEIDQSKLHIGLRKASDAHKLNPKLDRSTWTESGGKYTRKR